MWYERRAGWGSIKSHWCIVLFLSLSLSLSLSLTLSLSLRPGRGWLTDEEEKLKKLHKGGGKSQTGLIHTLLFLSFFFLFFVISLLLSLAFLDLQSQRSDRCVCQRVFHNAACGMWYEKKKCVYPQLWLPAWLLCRFNGRFWQNLFPSSNQSSFFFQERALHYVYYTFNNAQIMSYGSGSTGWASLSVLPDETHKLCFPWEKEAPPFSVSV